MKKSVKIIGAVLLFALLAGLYLKSEDGKELLKNEEDLVASTDTAALLNGTEEELSGTAAETENETVVMTEAGFSECEKQELEEIISSCLEKNINAMIEDGRFPEAVANYAKASSELVNINTAEEDELTKLNGVGPAKAAAIVRYRKEHGEFKSIDELTNVSGISNGTLEKLRDQVSL